MFVMLFAGLLVLGLILTSIARYREEYRRVLVILYALIALVYLVWRIGWTLPTSGAADITVGIIFLILEIFAIGQTIGFGLLFWRHAPHRPAPAIDHYPTVDVYIATYNEPVDIVETSAVAATQLDYPRDKFRVYICDDGDRPEMRAVAERWGIGYLRRDSHDGAKAGNLNNALAHTSGEFVVTMDADMILKPQFLKHTIGHMNDPKVAFVQSPQAFYNADVFQHNLFAENIMRNDQDFFMRFIEPQRDLHNAAIYVGSGAIFRRSALADIGGFVTDVITEDMATGLMLQNAGWQSVYVNEVLATGRAAETYSELLKQRARWARGNVQVAQRYGFKRLRNLNRRQRWLMFDSVSYWFFGVMRLAFFFLPLLVLAGNFQLLHGNLTAFLALWTLQFVYSRFVYEAVSKGRFKTIWTSVYEFAQAPQMAMAVLEELLLHRTLTFQVTNKGEERERASFDWRNAWPQLVLVAMSLTTISWCGWKLYTGGITYLFGIIIPLGWLLFNTVCLLGALAAAIDQPRYRNRLAEWDERGALHTVDETVPVHIEAFHTTKVCFSLPRARFDELNKQRPLVVSFHNFTLEIDLEYAEINETDAFVFAYFRDIPRAEFARLVQLLNQANTLRFQTRPSAHRIGIYDATIGLLVRALFRSDRILGRGHTKRVEIAAAVE